MTRVIIEFPILFATLHGRKDICTRSPQQTAIICAPDSDRRNRQEYDGYRVRYTCELPRMQQQARYFREEKRGFFAHGSREIARSSISEAKNRRIRPAAHIRSIPLRIHYSSLIIYLAHYSLIHYSLIYLKFGKRRLHYIASVSAFDRGS